MDKNDARAAGFLPSSSQRTPNMTHGKSLEDDGDGREEGRISLDMLDVCKRGSGAGPHCRTTRFYLLPVGVCKQYTTSVGLTSLIKSIKSHRILYQKSDVYVSHEAAAILGLTCPGECENTFMPREVLRIMVNPPLYSVVNLTTRSRCDFLYPVRSTHLTNVPVYKFLS